MPSQTSWLEPLIANLAAEIERRVLEEVALRVNGVLAELRQKLQLAGTPAPQMSPSGERSVRLRLCLVPGCGKPAAGPKYGWRCRDHGADYRAARASGQPALQTRIAPPESRVMSAGPAQPSAGRE